MAACAHRNGVNRKALQSHLLGFVLPRHGLAVGQNADGRVLAELYGRHVASQTTNDANKCSHVVPYVLHGRELYAIAVEDGDTKFRAKDKKSDGKELERSSRHVESGIVSSLGDNVLNGARF